MIDWKPDELDELHYVAVDATPGNTPAVVVNAPAYEDAEPGGGA